METPDIIPIQLLSSHYKVPISFINALHEYELVEVISVKKTSCIYKSQIKDVEKLMRLHYDLAINFEGIQAITNLLKQVESLQNHIKQLQNKLHFYENL